MWMHLDDENPKKMRIAVMALSLAVIASSHALNETVKLTVVFEGVEFRRENIVFGLTVILTYFLFKYVFEIAIKRIVLFYDKIANMKISDIRTDYFGPDYAPPNDMHEVFSEEAKEIEFKKEKKIKIIEAVKEFIFDAFVPTVFGLTAIIYFGNFRPLTTALFGFE